MSLFRAAERLAGELDTDLLDDYEEEVRGAFKLACEYNVDVQAELTSLRVALDDFEMGRSTPEEFTSEVRYILRGVRP